MKQCWKVLHESSEVEVSASVNIMAGNNNLYQMMLFSSRHLFVIRHNCSIWLLATYSVCITQAGFAHS